MNRRIKHILLALLSVTTLAGCHEGAPIPYVDDCFDENYNAKVPFTFVVNEGMDDAFSISSRAGESDMVRRYTLWAFKDGSGVPSFSFSTLSETPEITLPIGQYEFKVFCDYVDRTAQKDRYFFTDKVEELLMLNKSSYDGATHYKQSFWGEASARVVYKNTPIRIEMTSPMARIQYKASDMAADYTPARVKVSYLETVPSAIHGRTSEICYEWKDVVYYNEIGEEYLSFDYVFAEETPRDIAVMVEILDEKDEVKARTQEIKVPVRRKGITTVTGPFYTTMNDAPEPPAPGGGGIGINTGFSTTIVVEL